MSPRCRRALRRRWGVWADEPAQAVTGDVTRGMGGSLEASTAGGRGRCRRGGCGSLAAKVQQAAQQQQQAGGRRKVEGGGGEGARSRAERRRQAAAGRACDLEAMRGWADPAVGRHARVRSPGLG